MISLRLEILVRHTPLHCDPHYLRSIGVGKISVLTACLIPCLHEATRSIHGSTQSGYNGYRRDHFESIAQPPVPSPMVTMSSSNGHAEGSNPVKVHAPPEDPNHNAHRIRSTCVDIDGIPTTFVVQPFADRIFIIVTQLNKLGTILSASVDVTLAGAESYSVQVLMGKRDVAETEFCARNIMSHIKTSGSTKPLLLSLALTNHNLSTIRAVIDQVRTMHI